MTAQAAIVAAESLPAEGGNGRYGSRSSPARWPVFELGIVTAAGPS